MARHLSDCYHYSQLAMAIGIRCYRSREIIVFCSSQKFSPLKCFTVCVYDLVSLPKLLDIETGSETTYDLLKADVVFMVNSITKIWHLVKLCSRQRNASLNVSLHMCRSLIRVYIFQIILFIRINIVVFTLHCISHFYNCNVKCALYGCVFFVAVVVISHKQMYLFYL